MKARHAAAQMISSRPSPPATWLGSGWPGWLQLAAATAAIALVGWLGLVVRDSVPMHKAWLPAGVAVALVFLWGPRVLLAVVAGLFAVVYWWTGAAHDAALYAVGEAAVVAVCWGLLKWPLQLDARLQRLGDMARFISLGAGGYAMATAVALVVLPEGLRHAHADLVGARHGHGATAIGHAAAESAHRGAAATAAGHAPVEHAHHGAAAAAGGHAEPAPAAAHSVAHAAGPFEWIAADMLGLLLMTPLLFWALQRRAPGIDRRDDHPGSALATLALLVATCTAVYSGWLEATFGLRHSTLVVLPPAVWLALRHPLPYTLAGNLAVVLIADLGTSLGHGPFSDHTSGLPLLHLVFVGTTLLMAASQCERALAEREIQRLATRDALTDLPNRNLLALRLEAALSTAQRHQQRVGVLFIDLDHFKRINDSLGHAVGDQLLIAATERIASVLRADAMLARVGGDEFVAVLERLEDPEDASRAAARLIAALAHPFEIGRHVLTVSCSVGVASYPDDGANGGDLVKHADIAMYEAKSSGRNQFRFFSPAMNEQVRQRLEVENGLRTALQHGQLELHYQPIVDAASGALTKVEALVRWRRPDGSLALPGEFIRVAEDTGLIELLGAWVIDEAARQLRRWREAGLATVPVCVNLSARQLRHGRALSDHLRHALDANGLAGHDIVLEITESMLLNLGEEAEDALRLLARHGITMALDDFGTGYSSLGTLARLPIHCLKIDRSFVHAMLERPAQLKLVRAMVELAHVLGMHVIAEGVETAPQRSQLLELGADALQGFLIARPMPAAQLARRLQPEPAALDEA